MTVRNSPTLYHSSFGLSLTSHYIVDKSKINPPSNRKSLSYYSRYSTNCKITWLVFIFAADIEKKEAQFL
jgi:hypothetical protein